MKNYNSPTKKKNMKFLLDNDLVRYKNLRRFHNASGTTARKYLLEANVKKFIKELPAPLKEKGEFIYKLLRSADLGHSPEQLELTF
jgi:hypothetical protein